MTTTPRPQRSHEAKRITNRLLSLFIGGTIALVALALSATLALSNSGDAADLRMQIVQINETRATSTLSPEADVTLAQAQDALREAANAQSSTPLIFVWALCGVCIAVLGMATLYLYTSIVKPFMRLESFASDVARGELDLPLPFERSNPFGKFTWAFDNMRKEIKRARGAEAEAIEKNKTTIAALSHDIKTPIASIRTYSEALELGIARTDDERVDYARTIMRKCDEVASLTDDLFLHTLADLDRISVTCDDAAIDSTIRHAVADFDADGTVRIVHLHEASLPHDPKRLAQVLENLVANARKYAPGSPVEVSGTRADGGYRIEVRDFGSGMDPADLPFAFDRFYRGTNTGNAPGAGLGLFIVRYLVERMGGTVRLENVDPGLRVDVELGERDADGITRV